MKAVILAAGYAVRLQPLTLTVSKSLLPVGGKKIIDRILDKVFALRDRVDGVSIVTNGKFFGQFKEYAEGLKGRCAVTLVNDGTLTNETRLGAIRDLALAASGVRIADDLLVIAGDNLFDFDLQRFVDFARSKKGKVAIALHDVKDAALATKYGICQIDRDGQITDFEEKPPRPKATLASTCIYYFPKEKVGFLDEYMKTDNQLDAPGHYIKWLCERREAYGFVFGEKWYDIGDIASYGKADADYAGR